MYEAFVSARLASEAALDVLAGRAETVEPYAERLPARSGRSPAHPGARRSRSTAIPRTTFALARAPLVWPVVERLVRGDIKAPGEARGLARPPLKAIAALARIARLPLPSTQAEVRDCRFKHAWTSTPCSCAPCKPARATCT